MNDLTRAALAEALGDADEADGVIAALAQRDVFLMHWPEARAPKSIVFTSLTPAGPIRVEATDIDLGVRMTIGAELTNVALVLNLPYADLGMLGSWSLARAIKAQARLAAKNASPSPPGARKKEKSG